MSCTFILLNISTQAQGLACWSGRSGRQSISHKEEGPFVSVIPSKWQANINHPNSRDRLSSHEVACSGALCNHQRKEASLSPRPEMSALNLPSLIQGTEHAHGIPLRFPSPSQRKILHVGRPLRTYAFGLHAVYVCGQICDYNTHDDNDIMIVNMVSSTPPSRDRGDV